MTTFLSDIVLAGANDIQFKNTSGANTGKIESDGNNLVLSNAVGDILLGDGASDIYIGDGANSVDILFEVSGSLSAESGAELTLGGAGGTIALGGAISLADYVSAISATGVNTVDVGTSAKPFKNIYAAHHVGGSSINYATSRGWVEDAAPGGTQSGEFGGDFTINGIGDENAVVWGDDPFNNKALLWKCILNTSDNDSDGGWNKNIVIPANNNIGYLSYVYFKTDFTPDNANDGTVYLGGGQTTGQTLNLDGSNNTNPYSTSTDLNGINNGGPVIANRWYVMVGVYQAYNNSTTDNDTVSGVYDVETGEKVQNGGEFKMGNNTTGQVHRAYMYYDASTDANENVYFWNPGFHAIDGSEPKIQDLVKRQVYLDDNVKAAFGTGNDLEIYHDGSNSYIKDGGTGDLRIWADSPNIGTASGNKIFYGNSGAAELYFTGGNKKLETVTGGVEITGELQADTLDIDGNADISGDLTGLDNVTSTNFIIGGHTIDDVDLAGEFVDSSNHLITSAAANDRFAQINADTTGNAATVTNGVYTTGDQTIAGVKTFTSSIKGTPANANTNSLTLGRTDNSNYWSVNHAGNDFRLYNTASSGSHILFGVDASGTVKANNVGVGTATPGQKLDVVGNIAVSGTVDGIDIATRDAVLTSTTTTAGAALPKAGGTMSGAIAMGSQNITGGGTITGTTLTGTSLDINGAADISGNLTGVDTLTATTLSVTNYGLASGDIPNNAADTSGSAATLTEPRAINGVDFDGSAAITVTAAAGTLSGGTLKSTVLASSLTSVGTIGSGSWRGTPIASAYIAEGAINSQHYADGSIDTAHIADDQVTFAKTSGVTPNVYDNIIKILPSDFVANDDAGTSKVGIAYKAISGSSYGMKPNATTTELFALVSIPQGMSATHVDVFAKTNLGVIVYEAQTNANTMVSKGTGNCNTQINITDVSSTATNFLAIQVTTTATSDRVFGGQITIA